MDGIAYLAQRGNYCMLYLWAVKLELWDPIPPLPLEKDVN